MAKFTLVAISNPAEGREQECGPWYDSTHLPDMLSVPGVVTAQRFQLLRGAPSKAFKSYLALYEIEAEDEQSAKAIINTLNAANLPLSDALDVSSVNLAVYQATGPQLSKEKP